MASIINRIFERGLVPQNSIPPWLRGSVQYEVITGSTAYGVSSDTSDMDIYSWCVPPKRFIFPHTCGYIHGFSKDIQGFEQYQQHHVLDREARKNYDITCYSLTKYLRLVAENNPNMIDTLFVPQSCVLHATRVGRLIRDNRCKLLHKGLYHKFSGYAYSQMHKMTDKVVKGFLEACTVHNIDWKEFDNIAAQGVSDTYPQIVWETIHPLWKQATKSGSLGKRVELIAQYGFDVKFAYHVVRLLNEAEQLLECGDMDIQRDKEMLKAIRRGEVTLEAIQDIFTMKEKKLLELYNSSKLPMYPDEDFLHKLLLEVLEDYYGSLSAAEYQRESVGGGCSQLISEMQGLLDKYKN